MVTIETPTAALVAKHPPISTLSLLSALLIAVGLATGQTLSPQGDGGPRQFTIAKKITFRYPQAWALSEAQYKNTYELTRAAAQHEKLPTTLSARVLLTTEMRRNHAEAIERLAQIAASRRADAKFLEICGWPALQLRYRASLPSVLEGSDQQEDKIALWSIIAIADDELLVRLDATVAPGSPDTFADEVESIAKQSTCTSPPLPAQTGVELGHLERRQIQIPQVRFRKREGTERRRMTAFAAAPPPPTVLVSPGFTSESQVAGSKSGHDVIVVSRNDVATSHESGATYDNRKPFDVVPSGFTDPSVAVAQNNFYVSYLRLGPQTGCSAGVSVSTDQGANFHFVGVGASCPFSGANVCLPDQPQLAADANHSSQGHNDLVYMVWRQSTALIAPPDCTSFGGVETAPFISCSSDSGVHWSSGVPIASGDFPRVAVAGDGLVYAVYFDGDNIMITQFNSCAAGLEQQSGFPRMITSLTKPQCPVPGLDRCHQREPLANPTLAVDGGDPKHLYVAFAQQSSSGSASDDVIMIDSHDRGDTWGDALVVSSTTAGRRFMPWVCSAARAAFVSWYNRRAATAAHNDRTDFFSAGAFSKEGSLVAIPEVNLTRSPDPQCQLWFGDLPGAAPLGSGPDDSSDSESCSVQPQLAGVCQTDQGTGSGHGCDFNPQTPCPQGESCRTGVGIPKYGDYTGIGCADGRVFNAWSSATNPAGNTSDGLMIRIFGATQTLPAIHLTFNVTLIPAGDSGRFKLLVDDNIIADHLPSGNAIAPPAFDAGVHTVRIAPSSGSTDLNDYDVTFGDDCVNGTFGAFAESCAVAIRAKAFSSCTQNCNSAEQDCMNARHSSRPLCIRERRACDQECGGGTLIVKKVLVPASDPGRFDLRVDGSVRKAGAGDEDSVRVSVNAGSHTVTEAASSGTTLSRYTRTFSGDCDSSGHVTVNYGESRTCTIDNRAPGEPPPPAPPQLVVNVSVSPAGDPGKFNVLVDGIVKASNLGSGGSLGPLQLSAGTHILKETPGSGASLTGYTTQLSGDCAPDGAVTISFGQTKHCTFLNAKKSCPVLCSESEQRCNQQAGAPSGTKVPACTQQYGDCLANCGSQPPNPPPPD